MKLENEGSTKQDISGWVLKDGDGNMFTFPTGTELHAGKSLRVYTNTTGDYHFGSVQVWDDAGEEAQLLTAQGTVVQKFFYPEVTQSALLDVPVSSQAPYGNWGDPFGEACEETILIMIDHFYRGIGFDQTHVKNEILEIVDWENTHFGYNEDTSAEKIAESAHEIFSYPTRVSYEVSEEAIKQEIAQGYPVILSVSGRDLHNPHFKNAGPLYHVVLIVGFNEDYFITHDPGTSYGKNYQYSIDSLLAANHDLTHPEENIRSGPPAYVVIEP